MALCETFYSRAVDTWIDLLNSYDAGMTLSEESITDYHLLEVQRSHPDEKRAHAYNR